MKVRIKVESLDETVDVQDATALLNVIKAHASKRAPLLVRPIIKSMSDLGFAAEAVKRANAATGRSDPLPRSAQEFFEWALAQGYMSVLSP